MDLNDLKHDDVVYQNRPSTQILTNSEEYKDAVQFMRRPNRRLFGKMDFTKFTKKYFKVKDSLIREFLAEILCTFLLICFGCGSVAQYVLGPRDNYNSFLSLNLSWSTAVTMGILVCGKVSGAHMNPAVSFSMFLTGRLSVIQLFIYIIAQSIGALLGSVIVYVVYLDTLNKFDGGIRQTFGANATAGIWATYPTSHLSMSGAFIDQTVGTALLLFVVLAVSDPKNAKIANGIQALVIGNAVLMIGLAYGMNCGYGINPVRDFIPRVFTAISGWGLDVFRAANYYFWVPLIAPFVGSTIATFIYAIFIGNHWEDESDSIDKSFN